MALATYKVKPRDNLWSIAERELGDPLKYKDIAMWNGIPDPNFISIGMVLYLQNPGTAGMITQGRPAVTLGVNTNDPKELIATWTWFVQRDTESYKVIWTYSTGFTNKEGTVWFEGLSTTIKVDPDNYDGSRISRFTIPDNARVIKVKVKPIAMKKANDQPRWIAQWSNEQKYTNKALPDKPNKPSVTIKNTTLIATLDNIDITGATHIEFQLFKTSSSKVYKTKTEKIVTGSVGWSTGIVLGNEYKVRCRATDGGELKSDWSDYSDTVGTQPAPPSRIMPPKATSSTSILLSWGASSTAETYEIEYATNKNYFDNTDQTTTKSGVEQTSFEFIGLDSGFEYFFRVRAVNEAGKSSWSSIVSTIIGKDPASPTTWSSTTTAITGEEITLYWVHNAEDGSSQTAAGIEIYCNNQIAFARDIANLTDEDEKDKTRYIIIDTKNGLIKWTEDDGDKSVSWPAGLPLKEGCKLTWRVRTKGVTPNYGDWSVMRTVDIYAPPSVEIQITDGSNNEIDLIESFPFYIYALAGPETQLPIGYHVTITANEAYETTDNIGNEKFVNIGDEVYAKHFDILAPLLIEMSPGNIDLENNTSYTITVVVSMNSGLTAEATKEFTVGWVETAYNPNAEISINTVDYTATILPYCDVQQTVYREVKLINGIYTKTDTIFMYAYGECIPDAKTLDGEFVYQGIADDKENVMYIYDVLTTLVDTAYLSVYRREYDGSFVELATGLDSTKKITVTDPHPALDFARYRIVATDKATGAVSYTDLPGYPVGGDSVIIQWDDDWTEFETDGDNEPVQPPWSGSLLAIPYNIDVSDSNSADVSFVEYIGRKHPVTYHGTQLGIKSSWSMQIRKDDKETLYGLRRLAIWMGDVYVREPSGSGYWANVSVSFNQKHRDLTIPVTLDITRVEGGV